MTQFLVRKDAIRPPRAFLDGEEAHHAHSVFRLKVGDPIQIFDGQGQGFNGRITQSRKTRVEVEILNHRSKPSDSGIQITLGQCLIPRDAMDTVVLKATELGVREIIPLVSSRSQVKLDFKKRSQKQGHWDNLALAACKQCDRLMLPMIGDVRPLSQLVKAFDTFDLVLLAHKDAPAKPVKSLLPLDGSLGSVLVLIGPEGGFDPAEVCLMTDRGAHLISLGPYTLKSDTASLCLLSFLGCHTY